MKTLLTTLFIFIFIQSSFTQTPFLRRYTVDDGLPSSHVYRVFQDSEGFLWICTDRGLSRFDGYRFENFTTKNGLPYNDIWDIVEDNHKRLWFASYAHSIVYYDMKKHEFEVIPVSEKLPEFTNQKIYGFSFKSKNEVLAFGLPSIQINPTSKKIERSELIVERYNEDIIKLFERNQKSNIMYLASTLFPSNYRYLSTQKPYLPINLIPQNDILKDVIFIDKLNTFYSTQKSVNLLKNGKLYSKNISLLSTFSNDEVTRLDRFKKQSLLVFTKFETFVIDSNFNRLHKFDFLNNYKVNSVLFDNEDNLWLCTKDKGLLLLTKEAQDSYILLELENYAIKDILADKNKNIWLGTNTGSIFKISDNKLFKIKINQSSNLPIRNMSIGQSGKIFVVWESGELGIINNTNFINQKKIDPVIYEFVQPINRIGKRRMIIKNNIDSQKAVVIIFKEIYPKGTAEINGEFIIGTSNNVNKLGFDGKEAFLESYLYRIRGLALANDSRDNIWVGSSSGLWVANRNIAKNEKTKKIEGLNIAINDLITDDKDNVWLGTDGLGVKRYKNDKFLTIKGISDKIVNSLFYEKTKNRIWAATNEGVYAITEIGEDDYTVNKISLTQGLPTLEVHSVYADGDKLYAGTNNSLAVIDLKTYFEKQKDTKTKAPIIIKNIRINSKDTTKLATYNLDYRQNSIDIDFVALSYKSDKNIRYEYKLVSENTKNEWQEVNETRISFAFLASGDYKFYLKAFDIEGNESVLAKPINFNIAPPFWQTWWFRFLLLILGVGSFVLGFDIYRIRIKSESEISKKFAELELQALQSQMNPHFVFNALSSIQNYVLNKDTHTANEYLTNFSKLIRLFLESSRNRYIAISDEKVLLEKYIQLEQIRFNNKFDYQLKELNFIEPTYEIPSMLIQPFVENAINHGLVYKETKGQLSVTFEEKDNIFICIVEDDGIGRAKAKEIRTKTLKAYKSRATEIIEERLRTLKLVDGTDVTIDIIDKNEPESMGTRVEIKILLNK